MATITNPKNNETITTTMTDAEAVAVVAGIKGSEFARSLANANNRSVAQWFWVHKLANQNAKPAQPAPAVKYPNIVEFVARGGSRGKITFRTNGGHTVEIKTAGPNSRYPGQLWITNGAGYGAADNRFYGRVDFDGVFHPGRDASAEVMAFLTAALGGLDTNPAEYAANYGKETGNCCFCDTFIENPISVAVGYGPICARRFGLPHSKAAMKCAKAKKSQPTMDALAVA